MTMNSSYQLHQEEQTGSLEVGKFADLIVLDRNVLTVPAEQIASTKVLQTVVGGKIVYQAENLYNYARGHRARPCVCELPREVALCNRLQTCRRRYAVRP